MDNAGYTTLTRQTGLLREMQSVANNLANMSTTGFRKEGVVFAEYVKALDGRDDSLSMAYASGRTTDETQGALSQTGGTFDLAIEGEGFFMVDTPAGQRLTRAGAFTPNGEGELVTMDGNRLLDGGGSPVFIPPDARAITIAPDGTLSADGRPLAQIGLYAPTDPKQMFRENGTRFRVDGDTQPIESSKIMQGYLEASNVNPVIEVARMIEVQRAYELGQSFLEQDDQRIRSVMQTLGR